MSGPVAGRRPDPPTGRRAPAEADRPRIGERQTDVRMDSASDLRPDREAMPGHQPARPDASRLAATGAVPGSSAGTVPVEAVPAEAPAARESRRRRRRRERAMVPEATFGSYYGRPIIKEPTWKAPDVGGYLFLGGLAGASSTLAAAAQMTGRPRLARGAKLGAALGIAGSVYALVHDLGRPGRFHHMLRVFKPTSPMSVGSWLLAGYGPATMAAAGSELTGILPGIGSAATAGAGLLGPAVAAYTGVLIADTAVPVWHEAHRELPYVFVGSAAASAGGLGMLVAPPEEAGPARRTAAVGTALEVAAIRRMHARLGGLGEPLHTGTAGRLMRAGEALGLAGAATGLIAGRRGRVAAACAGLLLLSGSLCTRMGIFYAGRASAADPRYTVQPQRERLDAQRHDA